MNEFDLTNEEIREICRRYSLSVVVAHGIREGLSQNVRVGLAACSRVHCWPAVEALLAAEGIIHRPTLPTTGIQIGHGNTQHNIF